MSVEIDRKNYVLSNDQPVVTLDVKSAFDGLSKNEKLYAHFISKASWYGGLITFLQTSPESGEIFVLLHKLFASLKPEEINKIASENGVSNDEVKGLFVYACGVFSNAGNYKGFGDTKFVPTIEKDRLEYLLKLTPVWCELQPLWLKVKDVMYDLKPNNVSLGYFPGGCTTYLSRNVRPEDTDKVQNWLKTVQMECYNNRLFKMEENGKTVYEIRLASEEKGELKKVTEGDTTYLITRGDYSPFMGKVANYLKEASQYAANETEAEMLKSYVSSFKTGSLDDHKEGSRYWIKDKEPAVETYIGFIETYRDPAGVRGEFEGFVAIVNREMSSKFTTLVNNAEKFLTLLPWSKSFEKDKFLKPDFTSLDVLTFAGSGIPAGINIPNYDEIRQSEGFKNVSLGNVIPASYQLTVMPFLTQQDVNLLQKWRVPAFELQVGLHELLGHGSGKLLYKTPQNYPSTLQNPITGDPVVTYYEPGDTYDTKFGPLGSSYEECRAEAVGLYLSLENDVLKIFGHEGEQAEEVMYVNWLSLVWAGAGKGLELWEPGRGWLQAHAQARFVLARVLIEAGVASITSPKEGDLLVTLDRSEIRGAGRAAIANFLLKLQVYKSTGDIESAKKLYERYATVEEPWTSWRSIVLANKQPRKIFVQSNTIIEKEDVKLKSYEANPEGFIQSWVERFEGDEKKVYEDMLKLVEEDAKHF